MGTYDAQQVCLKGHQVTDKYHRNPQFRRPFCPKCGAKTIHQCQHCNAEIRGDYHVDGVAVIGLGITTPVPQFCEKCGEAFPWSSQQEKKDDEVTRLDPLIAVERICNRIVLVIRQLRQRYGKRAALEINDEYDPQDLLHALLLLFFDDVRPEEFTPSYAGSATRMDFLLKQESIVIEAKMTREGLGAKQVSEQLIVDIAHYAVHPNCKTLYCLVYDPEHRITNPRGLESDLSKTSGGLEVRVFIVPR
jgi:hypothetical protein